MPTLIIRSLESDTHHGVTIKATDQFDQNRYTLEWAVRTMDAREYHIGQKIELLIRVREESLLKEIPNSIRKSCVYCDEEICLTEDGWIHVNGSSPQCSHLNDHFRAEPNN